MEEKFLETLSLLVSNFIKPLLFHSEAKCLIYHLIKSWISNFPWSSAEGVGILFIFLLFIRHFLQEEKIFPQR